MVGLGASRMPPGHCGVFRAWVESSEPQVIQIKPQLEQLLKLPEEALMKDGSCGSGRCGELMRKHKRHVDH